MSVPDQNNDSWLHRVIDERADLEKKTEALRLFLGSDASKKLDDRGQADLREQLYHMEGYLWVLLRRIRTATKT